METWGSWDDGLILRTERKSEMNCTGAELGSVTCGHICLTLTTPVHFGLIIEPAKAVVYER